MEEMIFRNGEYKAYVNEYKVLGTWNGEYAVNFWCYGSPDYGCRGTHGTAVKAYETLDKAIAAAKRYVNKAK